MSYDSLSFVVGGGEMGERIRALDWSSTALGPLPDWPQGLKTATRIMLTSRQPIWIGWGGDLLKLYNDPYKAIIGGKHPWALGRPAREVWREIWPNIGPMLATAMGGDEGTYVEAQLLIMERSGYPEETYYTFSYSPIPDDQGRPGGIICANTDDTRRVIGERQLGLLREIAAAGAESRTLRQVYEQTARALATNQRDLPFASIYFAEPDGKGLSLVGWTPLGYRHPAFPQRVTAGDTATWPLAEVISDQTPRVLDDLEARFGSSFPKGAWDKGPQQAALIPIPARGETGRHGVLVAGLNPFRQFDDAYRGFLTLVAGEIAASLANAQAYEDERRRAEALAEIDRAKTLFFSNISHEFRTPLTLMLSPLEEILGKPAEKVLPDNRALVEVAHRNSLRLLKLVNSLLDFSRIEAGRAQAMYQPTDLAAFTNELASNFESACARAGLHLVIDCPPLAERAYIDRDMWEKIVLNLLSNAFKFTFKGEIAVRLRQVDRQVELRVSDTGVGIPAHELPRLFERFHRVENQRSRTHEGSGIGLALVQELVKLHQGSIKVESAVDRGTAFSVTIPLGRAHLPGERIGDSRSLASTAVHAEAYVVEALRWLPGDETPVHQPGEDLTISPQPAEGGRVLLADDNADMRAYVRRLLSSRFDVQAVADGQAAIEAIHKRKPDLLVADVMMPRLDGLGLVRAIRRNSALAELPVILLSARADDEARLEGLNAGADDYLTKPFNAHELIARVGANIKLAKMRRDAQREQQYRKAQFETLFKQAPLGIYLVDSDFRIREVNPTALPVFGEMAAGIIGRDFDEVIHILWEKKYADEVAAIFRRTLATGESYNTPHRAELRADRGVIEHYEWRVDRTTLPDGTFGVVCYFRDIAAQVEAENTRQLLLRELNHRVKNTLANVQAVAQQTMRSTKDPEEFVRRFSGRIQSLARVHALLTETTWEGADLRELIRDQLLHGAVDEARLTAWGPAVQLRPQMAVHLAVMLHELGTNSVKYGALSAPRGWVAINWTVTGDVLNVQWVERGGPPISALSRRGFGSALIEQSAKSEGGRAEQIIEPEGLTWKISMKLPHSDVQRMVAEEPRLRGPTLPQRQTAQPGTPLAGRSLLVVEDESLIAMDLVDTLERLGAGDVRSVSTESEGLALLEAVSFDCALLDANLHGRSVAKIAEALTERQVPFVFVTGYGRSGLPAEFQQMPVLAKPVDDERLVEAVTGLLSEPGKMLKLQS
ncbi:MAG TPA: response regulator [Xanthobacteraceae bacterium]|nr:response regulator [Xanthobacteraceae bacterium]